MSPSATFSLIPDVLAKSMKSFFLRLDFFPFMVSSVYSFCYVGILVVDFYKCVWDCLYFAD